MLEFWGLNTSSEILTATCGTCDHSCDAKSTLGDSETTQLELNQGLKPQLVKIDAAMRVCFMI